MHQNGYCYINAHLNNHLNFYSNVDKNVHLIQLNIHITVLINVHMNIHMVSLPREQYSIMHFAVPFLKMLTLYTHSQLLLEFYAVFCVYQILML